ncbi:MAG TPA: GNAT family N-acetyltransferase [Acidobacteriaceae bacterium]|nr:GNAT family N-acetyltransferase [Acidobacteriaceae bacterium]
MSQSQDGVVLRPYQASDREAFRRLNEAWIERYFGLEARDRETLGDPEGKILAEGGHIFMALQGETPVATCALLPHEPGVFEVAKMTVAESCRGRGLGRRILAFTIEQGRTLGAKALYLETNDTLHDAIHLYEALGFRHLPPERVTASPYARANVFMELVFEEIAS